MSFQEKSLWVLFIGLLAAFSFYFSRVLPTDAKDIMPEQVGLFVTALVLLVVTQIAGHILLAVIDHRTETDERDKLIELKGTRNASYVLAVGVFASICIALVVEGNFLLIHVLLGSWVVAQLVEIASQLVLYRRGA